ncbi:GNAT family N-acetyltransferase [Oryzifoliimicrobium ureilyticus]|uniref:GNAT family N-acetyltransferase n=1 Tax=Oryzifoliimicrobium ureilyticus TaxID=3113724 RepID=UPI0030761DBE
MAITIRDASREDEARWLELWNGYLAFYRVSVAPEVTASTFARVFDPASALKMRVAELDAKLVGFALFLTHEGTWIKGHDCYLEDLYVDAAYRGQKIGKALVDDLVAMSKEKGWSRLYWHTAEDNRTARALYDRYVQSDGHVRYRISFEK